jgi:hypothetical protein
LKLPTELADIDDARLVLGVRQGRARPIDDHQVRAAGEPEVLVRLIDEHLARAGPEAASLHLGHHGVHRVLDLDGGRQGRELAGQLQPQRLRRADVGPQPAGMPGLQPRHRGTRQTGRFRHRRESPSAVLPREAQRRSEPLADALHLQVRVGRSMRWAGRRHARDSSGWRFPAAHLALHRG